MNMGFVNPFPKNHCVVVALVHAARGDVEMALKLAQKAKEKGHLSKHGAAGFFMSSAEWWAGEVGLRVVNKVRYLRRESPRNFASARFFKEVRHLRTVERWLRNHTRGTYIVRVRNHAFAIVEGVAYGYYRPKSRVLSTIKLVKQERAA